MKISTKGRYAVRVMLDLALNNNGECIKVKEIAARQGISEKYLEQIIAVLNKAGYVKSVRGAQGGYRIAKDPADFTVGMILRLTEGSLAPVACLEEGADICERCDTCETLEVWQELYDAVNKVVDGVTIADLVEAGHMVVVAHGNGPQVGMIQNAFSAYCKQEPSADVMPLSMCVAMSQGYIGYDLQNALKEELLNRGLQQGVATVLTQVVVDGNDPAFQHPTKPIGAFMSKEEAEKMAREKGWHIAEDAGRGWRQVVASPKPLAVVELTTIRALAEADNVVIACGGGGIPVIATDHHHLKGAAAVIDKDLASELLAEHLDADMLIILTAVEKVAVNFNKPNQKWLDTLTPEEARTYIGEGQFAPGSMLPKVEAAVKFAESKPGRTALITLLEKARDGIDGKTGTRITC
jgi:carbamate kinase